MLNQRRVNSRQHNVLIENRLNKCKKNCLKYMLYEFLNIFKSSEIMYQTVCISFVKHITKNCTDMQTFIDVLAYLSLNINFSVIHIVKKR